MNITITITYAFAEYSDSGGGRAPPAAWRTPTAAGGT